MTRVDLWQEGEKNSILERWVFLGRRSLFDRHYLAGDSGEPIGLGLEDLSHRPFQQSVKDGCIRNLCQGENSIHPAEPDQKIFFKGGRSLAGLCESERCSQKIRFFQAIEFHGTVFVPRTF